MAEHQTRNPDDQKAFNPPGVEKPYNNDEVLRQQVKAALFRETQSAGIDVQVGVEDGKVRLHGVVDVLSHKRAAEEIARRIPGVTHIENDVTVANEEPVSDRHLLERIEQRLSRNPWRGSIGCRVHKGVVTLVGHAATNDQVYAAIREAEGTAGVREVRVARVKVGEGRKEDDADVSRAAEHLLDEMGYDHRLFEVYSDAGVLFVKGFVPTGADKSRIKTAMHRIPGVDKLEALLIAEDRGVDEVH